MYGNIKFLFFFCRINNGTITINNVIKEVRELFNELRSNLSREETKRIKNELYKK